VLAAVGLVVLSACGGTDGGPAGGTGPDPAGPSRGFRMGFSALPPRNDLALVPPVIDLWSRRADAAIAHVSVPWAELAAGLDPDLIVDATQGGLAQIYRQKGLPLTMVLDVTDGLDRTREAPALVGIGRSVTEPGMQLLYRRYVAALVRRVRPEYLGLAAETNLIRAVGPPGVYAAIVAMTNAAAPDARATDPSVRLFVSVQVEVAWGRPSGTYVGIDTDLADFPFITALGLSSYPYLGGFAAPEDLPADYYRRIPGGRALTLLVAEGGWPSGSVPGFASSAETQGRYLRRQAELAEAAGVVRLFQLTFTDIDSSLAPGSPNLAFFTTLGLVDTELRAKSSLAVWDEIFARRLR
jgi:hypothetical protein